MSTAIIPLERENFAITVTPEALEVRDQLLAEAALVRRVVSDLSRDTAVEMLQRLKALTKETEDTRKELKAPVLELGKEIDRKASEFAATIQEEYLRIDQQVCEWETKQRLRQQALEEARQRELAEAQRKLDQERLAAERERLRIEVEKQAAIADARRVAEEAKTAEARELAREAADIMAAREAERLKAEELKRAEEAKRAAEIMEEKATELGPPMPIESAEGQLFKEELDFEVTNIHQLYLARGQECVEMKERRGVIKALINAGGVKELPGVRIFKVAKNQVRVPKKKSGRFLDV